MFGQLTFNLVVEIGRTPALTQLARFGLFSSHFRAFIARESAILQHRDLENGNYSH